MGYPLYIRRAQVLDIRDRILASGGGAVHVYGSVYPGTEEDSADAPLVIRSLAASDLVMHATDAYMLIEVEANVAVSGMATWARFVDGTGATIYDASAGLPGSGAQLIVSDGQDPPGAAMYPGGVVTMSIEFVRT